MSNDILHLDLETFAEPDLKQVGVHKQLSHPSAEIMMSQYALNNDPVTVVDWTSVGDGAYLQKPPRGHELVEMLEDPNIIIEAFNAPFERLALGLIWGIVIPPERFRCTMVKAYGCGFFGGMGEVGEQIGLNPDKKKLKTGKALIRRFCMPTPGNHKVRRYTRHTHPEEWAQFLEYGRQDVVTEREISMLLAPYPLREHEQKLWCLDQKINDTGVLIDLAAVDGAITIDAEEKHALRVAMKELTGLDNPNSGPQLLGWLKERGVELENLQKATVAEAIDSMEEGTVLDVLKLKQKIAKTSVTKYKAFKRAANGADQRFRGALQFFGAQRTGRWGGRLVQLHNLAKPKIKHPELEAWMLQLADRKLIEMAHGDVTSFLSSCIRCVITAPKGKKLVVSDFSSVESRIVAWLSGCERMMRLFAEGKDSYKDFASELFGIPYEEVTKEQRNYSKPPTLGCAYRLGAGNKKTGEGGLMDYSKGMGVIMSYDDAKHAVDTFRGMYLEIEKMWYWYDDACADVIKNHTVREGYGVKISRDNNFMMIQLPSGRKLHYYKPLIEMRIPPWEMDKEPELVKVKNFLTDEWEEQWIKPKPKLKATITYMGKSKMGNQWVRLQTHGGKVTENVCQAIGVDLLGDAMTDLDRETPWPVCLHVHDEAVQEVDENIADEYLKFMDGVMSRARSWAPGLLMGAAGFVTDRYTKD